MSQVIAKLTNGGFKGWAHGAGSAFVAGGASAISAGFTSLVFDPMKVGFGWNTVKFMAGVFVVSGIIELMIYLRTHALPPLAEKTTTKDTVKETPTLSGIVIEKTKEVVVETKPAAAIVPAPLPGEHV